MDDAQTTDITLKLAQMKADALALDLKQSLDEAKALRYEAEKVLLFEEVVRNSKDGVIITQANFNDPNGPTIIYVNEAFTTISGYTSEEIVGKTPRMLQGEKTDPATLKKLRNCLESGQPFHGELLNYGKNGNEYWLDINIIPIRNAHGRVTHFAAIERDFTERKAFEAELVQAKTAAEKAQKKAEEIAQFPLHNPDPLMKIDIDKEALLFVNPAAYNKYSDILKKGMSHPLLAGIIMDARKAYDDRKPVMREVIIGKVIYQQVITANFLAGEQTATIYCYDITKLKKTEETLREETLKAEAASRAKSDFLANMSHELRTPMNGVLGMAGLLKDMQLNPEQRELVQTIFNSGESLLLLLNDILDLSKIEAGQLTLEDIPFNLNSTIHETVRLLDPLAKNKNITLNHFYNATTPDCVIGDPARIRQVVTNLVGNALKFTQEGYVKLDVSARRLPTGVTEFLFRVDDTGIGINEKYLDKIFQKFTQADESTTRRFGGTGLGLTVCKLLVEAMGGTIGVESILGKGSSFWFTLPLQVANAEQTERLIQENKAPIADDEAKMDFSKRRIIVVDDHPVNLFFAKKLLTKFGFGTVDTAEDGISALRMTEKGRYDLIITDCQMPEMDGYEVSKAIRQREEGSGKRTPIIAMTANAMVGDREKCLEAGMDDYVSKPINSNRLMEVLVKYLSAPVAVAPAKPVAKTVEPVIEIEEEQEVMETRLPPVDLTHLSLYVGDDAEERKMVFGLFTHGAEESLAVLAGNIMDGKNIAWKKAAHKLKGSAANFGALPLSYICKEAEEKFESSADVKQALFLELSRSYKEVSAFLGNL